MRVDEHIEALVREGELLAAAVARADPDAAVPTCPEWTVRELTHHIGRTHRWADAHVRDARPEPVPDEEQAAIWGTMPGDADLVAWFREGHARLVSDLRAAAPELACWSFLPAPSPLAFWARRQAHETAIHRADAQAALGTVDGHPAEFAVDGVDELLTGFFSRAPNRVRADAPRTLRVTATDADGDWTVHIGPQGARGERTASEPGGGADCRLSGPASDLYLALWNRRGTGDLAVEGDRSLLDLWRERAKVRWS